MRIVVCLFVMIRASLSPKGGKCSSGQILATLEFGVQFLRIPFFNPEGFGIMCFIYA